MNKIDFKRELKHLYRPSTKEFQIVDVPPMSFLMIDGHGDPNTEHSYKQAVEALYAVSYKLKFRSKKELGRDYVVPPLEGLWWAEDMDSFTVNRDKSTWFWTMMIMQPEWITGDMYAQVSNQVIAKEENPALSELRLETYHEGLSVQILHLGSYDDEGPVIAGMHSHVIESGYRLAGKHHEIYLSDPRKVAPEKLKTVLRQPISTLDG